MKYLLSLLLAFLSCASSFADTVEEIDGIFIFIPGTSYITCFGLLSIPSITYSDDGRFLYVTFQGEAEPILRFPMLGNALEVFYGTYIQSSAYQAGYWGRFEVDDLTGIENVPACPVQITERNNRKYISGGKLIIAKDNHLYDANGKMIK